MNPRMASVMLLLLVLAACAREAKQDDAAADKLKSQRERDSVLGQSKVPGASGVGKAITVADSAGNRVHVQDSIATSE